LKRAVQKYATPVDKAVGARIRVRRLELGVTQERLAEKIGVTFQQVQKYEKAINRVGASRLYAIAAVLNVDPSYFFDGMSGLKPRLSGSSVRSDDLLSRLVSSRDGMDLVNAFRKIESAAVRKQVVELVRQMTVNR
jgi:transcriptional regulator with XRE-family HTH domain